MKTIKIQIVAMAVTCMFVTASLAQEISPSKVPSTVKLAFKKSHLHITPTWEIEDGYYEAAFSQGKTESSAFYTAAGKLVKSETGISLSQLPVSARGYVTKHFKGKHIQEVAKVTAASGNVTYFVVVKGSGKATIFDSNGKYLKTVKD